MSLAVTAVGQPGDRAPILGWQVASSREVGDDGSSLSSVPYDAQGWRTAPARSTVMAALLAAGEHPDVFFSTNMRDTVDPAEFAVPWWFRSLFTVSGPGRTHLRVDGVIPRADLWVNGRLVADTATFSGAYPVTTIDVTDAVGPGLNALALCVHPGNPMQDLSIGWVDWAPPPPDDNMGPWRDVVVGSTGPVRLGAPHVESRLLAPPARHAATAPAELTVAVEASNVGTAGEEVRVVAHIEGPDGDRLQAARTVVLAPGETTVVAFGGPEDEDLRLSDARLWWPTGEGAQPLYRVSFTATVAEALSDRETTRFGVRTVASELRPGDGRQWLINGHPVQILGGGWSPDLFLRHDHRRLADQLALTRHLGLNAIRPEGKLENPEFYDLCDELGIMVLPGWECCNKWESAAGTGGEVWDETDLEVAERSMASEAVLLRNHPSVVGFLIGSDFAPPDEVASRYARALQAAGWNVPVVASATDQGSPVSGPSGMKMTGPYDWVAPSYWYEDDPELGGAIGFNSETSAGHTVPRLPSLRTMLSPAELEDLWQNPSRAQYHSGTQEFGDLRRFSTALAERYGRPKSLTDFVDKAQLAVYEAVRAQFEAFASRAGADRPATGVIYWMLNAPWPSLNWQLFDYELDTPGSAAATRKALEPLHALYAYDRRSVQVLNRTGAPTGALELSVRRYLADGAAGGVEQHQLAGVDADAVVDIGTVEPPEGAEGAWWLELELLDGGRPASRNVYWLSTAGDVLDRSTAAWHSMGVSRYADLRALDELRRARVGLDVEARRAGGELTVHVHLVNADPSGTPAVLLHPSLHAGRAPIAPVRWDDADVTLFGGQEITLTGRGADSGRHPVTVRVDGFNLYRPLVQVVSV
ncbi:MAG TPA: hypothetical protein VKV06_12555 [Acidimicrobiales bacterium]|nr:hypothetical protein [Acidimicrobiales bacterium]